MRLYYGGYGHHPRGKQYVYLGGDNYRTGQNVVVPVRQWKSGKLYNTMFTIQRSSNVDSKMSINEMQRLTNQGTSIKFIEGSNVMSLPGASDWKSAKQWKEWSNLVYEEEIKNRLKNHFNKKPDFSISNTELEYYKVDKPKNNEEIKEIENQKETTNSRSTKRQTPKININYKIAQNTGNVSLNNKKSNTTIKNKGSDLKIQTTTSYEGLSSGEVKKARLKGNINKKDTTSARNRLLGY